MSVKPGSLAGLNVDKLSVQKLYRDCLRLAMHLGSKQTSSRSAQALIDQVRLSFRRNADETDPEVIKEHKEAAVRGLGNYMFMEATKMAKDIKKNRPKEPDD